MSLPPLSIVVAASDSPEAVGRLLDSMEVQPSDGLEILIIHVFGSSLAARSRPGLRWIAAEPGSGVHRLRAIGANEARGAIVAFTEDSCRVARGWARSWLIAFRSDPEVVSATGPVEPAGGLSLIDLAVVLCEYGPFLGPGPVGQSHRLAGNNFAVRRSGLPDSDEVHEWDLAAARTGRTAWVAGALAIHDRTFRLREAIVDRLRTGLDYGRRRSAASSPARRLLMTILGPLILGSQAGRLVATLASKGSLEGRIVASLPISFALLAAWSVGEWLGWIASGPDLVGRRPGTGGRPGAPGIAPLGGRRSRYTPSRRAA